MKHKHTTFSLFALMVLCLGCNVSNIGAIIGENDAYSNRHAAFLIVLMSLSALILKLSNAAAYSLSRLCFCFAFTRRGGGMAGRATADLAKRITR
jgi:DMSO reductase anchor subunit